MSFAILDNLHGMEAILPLFAQLEQPEFNFEEDLLPDLLNLLSGTLSPKRSLFTKCLASESLHFC
jgi:hypothetical protein